MTVPPALLPERLSGVPVPSSHGTDKALDRAPEARATRSTGARRSHPQLDAKSRRLRRLDRDEDDGDDLDWDAWWDKRRDATRELQDDPELEWYEAEMEQRRSEVWRWRRRVESAKEVAGIGTVPADPDEGDS